MRGWWNTVEIVLSEISNSLKPYASIPFGIYQATSKLRLEICIFEPNNLEEFSNRIPPTSHLSQAAGEAADRPARQLSSQPGLEKSV